MIVAFYPVEITRRVIEGKETVLMFGRTDSMRKIIVIDQGFRPFFYVVPERPEKVEELLKELNGRVFAGDGKNFRVEAGIELKKLLSRDVVAIRVTTRTLNEQYIAASELAKSEEVEGVFENDIEYACKYSFSRGITPLKMLTLEGSYINFKSKVSVFSADRIVEGGTEQLKEPESLVFLTVIRPATELEESLSLVEPSLCGINTIPKRAKSEERLIEDILVFDGRELVSLKNKAEDEKGLLLEFQKILDLKKPDFLVSMHLDSRDLPVIASRASFFGLSVPEGIDHTLYQTKPIPWAKSPLHGFSGIDLAKLVFSFTGKKAYTIRDAFLCLRGTPLAAHDPKAEEALEQKLSPEEHIKQLWALWRGVLPLLTEASILTGLFPHQLARAGMTKATEYATIAQLRDEHLVPKKRGFSQKQEDAPVVRKEDSGLVRRAVLLSLEPIALSEVTKSNISPETFMCSCCPRGDEEFFCRKKRGVIAEIVSGLLKRRERIREMLKAMGTSPLLQARESALSLLLSSYLKYVQNERAKFGCPQAAPVIQKRIRESVLRLEKTAMMFNGRLLAFDETSAIVELPESAISDEFLSSFNEIFENSAGAEMVSLLENGAFFYEGREKGKKLAFLAQSHGKTVIKWQRLHRRKKALVSALVGEALAIAAASEKPGSEKLRMISEISKHVIETIRESAEKPATGIHLSSLTKSPKNYGYQTLSVSAASRLESLAFEVWPERPFAFIVAAGKSPPKDSVSVVADSHTQVFDIEHLFITELFPLFEEIFEPFGILLEEIAGESQKSLSEFLTRKRGRKKG